MVAVAVARKVKLGMRTLHLSSSLLPFIILSAARESVSPTVHELVPIAYLEPMWVVTSASNSESCSPFVSMPEARADVSLSDILSKSGTGGLVSLIFPG